MTVSSDQNIFMVHTPSNHIDKQLRLIHNNNIPPLNNFNLNAITQLFLSEDHELLVNWRPLMTTYCTGKQNTSELRVRDNILLMIPLT